jgi:hypothetical protein
VSDACYVPLTREEARVAAAALRGVLDGLQSLMQEQVEKLPPGDAAWAETAEACAAGHAAWVKLANAAEGHGAKPPRPPGWTWCREHGDQPGHVWACPECLRGLQPATVPVDLSALGE